MKTTNDDKPYQVNAYDDSQIDHLNLTLGNGTSLSRDHISIEKKNYGGSSSGALNLLTKGRNTNKQSIM